MKIKAQVTPDGALKKNTKAIKNKNIKVSIEINKNFSRKKQIEQCENCNGNPELELINLEGFEGEKCKKCLLVKSWKKK